MEEPRPSSNALIMALDQNRWVSPKRISKVLMFNMRPLLPQERSRHGATLTITLLTQSGISPPPQKKAAPFGSAFAYAEPPATSPSGVLPPSSFFISVFSWLRGEVWAGTVSSVRSWDRPSAVRFAIPIILKGSLNN